MKNAKYFNLVIIIIFFSCAEKNSTASFEGNWNSEKDNANQTFSVNITKSDNLYTGSYCAIAEAGNKIDCGVEGDAPSFTFSNVKRNQVIVDFVTYYGTEKGKVKLKFQANKLSWEIIKEPEGMYYCPKNAVLIKQLSDNK